MKRHLLALGTALLLGQSGAANLAPTLWNYVIGKGASAPVAEDQSPSGEVMRVWASPKGLGAESAVFLYMPKLSTDHWMFIVSGTSANVSDYMGTAQLKTLKTQNDATKKMVLYQVEGGMYKGLIAVDVRAVDEGRWVHSVGVLTPKMIGSLALGLSSN